MERKKPAVSEDAEACEGGSGEDGSQRWWEGTHACISQMLIEGHFLPVTVLGAEDAWINRTISEAQVSILKEPI